MVNWYRDIGTQFYRNVIMVDLFCIVKYYTIMYDSELE